MCGIWDWQSTIVKDLNDSQDPKYTLFCRENAFVAIYALFQTTNVRFLPIAQSGHCVLFLQFFLYDGFPKFHTKNDLGNLHKVLGLRSPPPLK